jgi:predicted amidohydrolase YtcJ
MRVDESFADLVLCNGTIHALDDRDPAPQAFAVRDGRFVAVGPATEIVALRGPATEMVDASGCTVLPGLIDGHLHLTNLGLNLSRVDLHGAQSIEDVVERTAAFAQSSAEPWILGRGWDQNLWSGAFPTHEMLSAALPDRPVALARVDGHALLANAHAMRLASVDRSTGDPAGGRILRDGDGNPSGVFIDAAQTLVYQRVPPPTHEQLLRAVRAAVAECNRWGVTAVAEPGVDRAVLAAQIELIERGEYTIRNYAMLADDAQLIEARLRAGILDGAYDGRLWTRAIKLYADGALGSRGAALLEPYADDPENRGLVLMPQARVVELTERAIREGLQPCVHAIGDRANRMVLDAFESALRCSGADGDVRPRIEHAQIISPQDIPRFARLGVTASVQSAHQISDMGWAEDRLGPKRARHAYPWRSLIDAGARLSNGTDAPVESASPLRTFHAAISRQNEAGEPAGGWHPEQCMTRREAIASMTAWAARAGFQEKILGSITPGKYADFVIVDRDWMTIPTEEIMHSKILSTYFAGRRVYGASCG